MAYTKQGPFVNDSPPPINATRLNAMDQGIYDTVALASIAALKAVSVTGLATGDTRRLLGYYAAGDGGGGLFRYNSASTAADDGGSVIAPNAGSGRWERVLVDGEMLSARGFGATGDNTTNDTTALQNALNAAAGTALYIQPATSKYKITGPLVPPANTYIKVHPDAVIRQDTKYTPVFDILDQPNVTIDGGSYRYEGNRDYSVVTPNVRGNSAQAYGAAIWTNSDGTTLLGTIHAYGFAEGLFVSGWDTISSTILSYSVKDVYVEHLEVDTVDWGVLAGNFDGLTINVLRGYVVQSPTGTSGPGLAPHLLYLTAEANLGFNRGFNLNHGHCRDSSGAPAFQFKNTRGGNVGKLYADNCNGAATFTNAQDLSVGQIVATRSGTGSGGGAIEFDTTCEAVHIHDCQVRMDSATPGRVLYLDGTDNWLGRVSIVNTWTTTDDYDIIVDGTRNHIEQVKYRNTTSTGSRVVALLGTDNTVGLKKIIAAETAVEIRTAAVNPIVSYNPNDISLAAVSLSKIFYNTTPTNPRLDRGDAVGAYSTTGGAAVNVIASEVSHVSLSANATNAFTISNPTQVAKGLTLTYDILNNSGGTLGAITWDTAFTLNETFVNPAAGSRKSITFRYDGTAWREIAATGNHTHAAADVTSGVFATARLGSGTASAAAYLRGDGAWAPDYQPHAYPIGGGPTQTTTTINALAAAGGTLAVPVVLEGSMLLDSVSFWNTDTASAHGPVEFALYQDQLNNANALPLVTGAVGTLASFTPTIASLRTISVTTPPITLPRGSYWLVIKNNHATLTLGLGVSAFGTMAQNVAQTKTLSTSAFGSTLDFVLATWTKINTLPGVRLNGRSFGQASAF